MCLVSGLLFLGCIQSTESSEEISEQEQEGNSTENGFLEGTIAIGPLCPVVEYPPDPACQPTEETYEAYSIAVWTLNKETKVANVEPNLDGSFGIEIPEGTYVVDFEDQHPVAMSNLPSTVVIDAGETTIVNIDVDTGIR